MQIANIQSFSFNGIYTPANFSPTVTQERMINTIKNKLTKDTDIFRKGKNFHDYLDSQKEHFMLSNGEYKDEISIYTGHLRQDNFMNQYYLGSYSENRLDNLVNILKAKRHENEINSIAGTVAMLLLGIGIIGMTLLVKLRN